MVIFLSHENVDENPTDEKQSARKKKNKVSLLLRQPFH